MSVPNEEHYLTWFCAKGAVFHNSHVATDNANQVVHGDAIDKLQGKSEKLDCVDTKA